MRLWRWRNNDWLRGDVLNPAHDLRPKDSMVILHIVAPAQFGGLEHVVRALAGGLARAGHEVHVAAIIERADQEHLFLTRLERAGVTVHTLAPGPRGYRRERAEIAALCRRIAPDVVHTHGYRPDVLDAGVALRLGLPLVTTLHGFTGGGWKNRLYERLQRRSVRRFDRVVAVSRSLAQFLAREGVPAELIEVVPNAWEATEALLPRDAARDALGIPPHSVQVGWVGRMTAEKGADVLVDALAQLSDLPLAASFVGEGPDRAMLEARAVARGLGGRLQWHGMIADAGRFFAAFDLFVLSSRTEGTPITLFEAMAAGVPVVATTVGGVPDVVSSTEALLVPPDDPVLLAAAIRLALLDRAGAGVRAADARARLERDFAVGPWVARYEAVYRRVRRG
jgi:glycosyltransferase involved in cell wall biosynthesis